jgi:hypothetical protein
LRVSPYQINYGKPDVSGQAYEKPENRIEYTDGERFRAKSYSARYTGSFPQFGADTGLFPVALVIEIIPVFERLGYHAYFGIFYLDIRQMAKFRSRLKQGRHVCFVYRKL